MGVATFENPGGYVAIVNQNQLYILTVLKSSTCHTRVISCWAVMINTILNYISRCDIAKLYLIV